MSHIDNEVRGVESAETREEEIKTIIEKHAKLLKIDWEYKTVESAHGDMLEHTQNLLAEFFSTEEIKDVHIKKNSVNISGLLGGRLNNIQLRPFKNGVALAIVTKLLNSKERELNIILIKAVDEDDEGIMISNTNWNGTNDGLKKGWRI